MTRRRHGRRVRCADAAKPPVWHDAFARMGAAQVQVKLNEAVVWTRPGVVRRDPRGPYYSVFGSDAAVFGQAKTSRRHARKGNSNTNQSLSRS